MFFLCMLDVTQFGNVSQSSSRNSHSFAVTDGQCGLLAPAESAALGLAIGLHLLNVFLEADGEARMAGSIADEIEIVGLCRVHGGT